jgi:predicted CoA-substrate-specific enzyme activase
MTKVVIMDRQEAVCASVVQHTGAEHRRLANKVMEEALLKAGLSFDEIAYVVATGYGRMTVPFADRQITELTCHTRGVSHFVPEVRLAIDIGGQDAKGLKIKNGRLSAFVMSDKCAAGTGRFLEIIADSLGLGLDELGPLSLNSLNSVSINNTCTVFAKKEVVSRLSEGVPVEDILAGVHNAIADRIARMVVRLNVDSDAFFTGGVAKNIGVVKALEIHLCRQVLLPEEPLLTGAIGAALLGREIVLKALAEGKTVPKGERHLSEIHFFD